MALGQKEKKICKSEIQNSKVARKSIVAKKTIKKNEIFTEENLCTKRPGTGISPMLWDKLIGKRSKKDFSKDDLIEI